MITITSHILSSVTAKKRLSPSSVIYYKCDLGQFIFLNFSFLTCKIRTILPVPDRGL